MSDWTGIPSWLGDFGAFTGVVGLLFVFVLAMARRWLYTRGQVQELLEARDKVAALWEKVADERQELVRDMTEAFEPVVTGNAAILRAVEQLQLQHSDVPRQRDPRRTR